MNYGDDNIGKKLGDYTMEKFLGAGQFGSAYLSRKVNDPKYYAIKVVPKSKVNSNPKLKEMFHSEIAIMQKINHPNVIRL